MAQKRRARLVLSLLVAAAPHCAAHELNGRHLVTFNMTPTVMLDVNESKDLKNFALLESQDQEELATIAPNEVAPAVAMVERPPTEMTARNEAKAIVKIWTGNKTATVDTSEKRPPGELSTSVMSSEISANTSTTETSVGDGLGQTDMVVPTIQRNSGLRDSSLSNGKTAAPATAGSVATDTVVNYLEEANALPLAGEIRSVDSPSVTTSAGKANEITTLPASIDSNGSNNTVIVSLVSGSKGTDRTSIPGQVHASSSADVRLDGSSKVANPKSSFHLQGTKTKKEASTATEDHGAHCSTNCSKGDSREKSSSDTTRSNDDGSSGLDQGLVDPGRVTDVYTRSALYYNMDTGSIVAIVCVIAGIVGLLVLFAAISRKKNTDEDDESSFRDGYNMDIRSIVRYSPTFLEDGIFMESDNNGTALTVAAPAHQSDGVSSISAESSDEVPSLRRNKLVADRSGDTSGVGCVSSMHSFDRDVDAGNVQMSSLFSTESSTTSDSEISCSWSSVLASDRENCSLRNTRDTTLSAWSATNLSPFGSTTNSAPGRRGMTRSSSTDYR